MYVRATFQHSSPRPRGAGVWLGAGTHFLSPWTSGADQLSPLPFTLKIRTLENLCKGTYEIIHSQMGSLSSRLLSPRPDT